jgi:hypothetical protein
MKTRKVPLQIKLNHMGNSSPFAMSRHGKGVLVHRTRSAGSIIYDGVYSHDYASYWCGNGSQSPLFFENPPDNRVVCANCEARAVAKGHPTTDALAGKHVHVGVLRVHKTCCQDSN